MSNFGLGWRNHVFYETGATLSLLNGSVGSGDLAALQDMRLSKRVAMTDTVVGAGHAQVIIDWEVPDANAAAIQLVGLLNYGITATGADDVVVQISVSGVAGTGDIVGQSVTRWERPSADFPLHLWAMLDSPIADGYRVSMTIDAGFSAGGTLEVTAGGLWIGPIWSPPDGIEATWSQAVSDPGSMGRSVGNQGYPRRRQRYRSFEGRAIHVPFAWAFGDETDATVLDIQQLLYRIGTTEPIALFPRTQNAAGDVSVHVMHRLGIYGHMAETGRIEHLGGDLYQWTGARVDELM